MMNLTKQEAIKWHRKMWIWIAKKIARDKQVKDISLLKIKFLYMNGITECIVNNCFCCEYAKNDSTLLIDYNCSKCPVVWGNSDKGKCYYDEYGLVCNMEDWKKQAKLAYKIAMLPEREDV